MGREPRKGTSIAKLVSIDGAIVMVRGLDCVDGTPLLDLKPDRALFTPIAPPQPGDFQADGIGAKLPPLITG
jgi:tRNA (adenine37-N6)-methyltransferase